MIPKFPRFAHLQPKHLEEINKLVRPLSRYSDCNPVSLLAWDFHGGTRIATLHGNLVIIFADYLDGTRFLSLYGTHEVKKSLTAMFRYAKQHDIIPELRLIPEETAQCIQENDGYTVSPDRDNYDYLISLHSVGSLAGKTMTNVRRQVKNFTTKYKNTASFVTLNLADNTHIEEIESVFRRRESQKGTVGGLKELAALKRLIRYHSLFSLFVRGVRIRDSLQAFIIIEETPDQAVGHFWKADVTYKGIYQFLLHNCCKVLLERGHEFMNIEQDFGHKNLRGAKRLLRPPAYLRKYSIEPAPKP